MKEFKEGDILLELDTDSTSEFVTVKVKRVDYARNLICIEYIEFCVEDTDYYSNNLRFLKNLSR